jgi:putative glutamine amidotransferase
MKKKRPIIAITMRIEAATDRFYLGRHYSEAVYAAGGLPLHVSLIPVKDYIEEALANAQGVLLPGSDSDVEPLRYGQEPRPRLGTVQPLKDETDALVIAAAEERNLPLLAICYGMQALNVARGGSLIQDIGAELPDVLKHEQGSPRERLSHNINLTSGCRLARLAETERALVNSHHHQAVAQAGEHLQACAWASDGVVEALEDTRPNRYNLAVQWHPELTWESDAFSFAIFNDFIKQCSENVS